MPLQVSRRILYRVCAVAALPIAGYNLVVGLQSPDHNWEQQYVKALVGGITLIIISIVLTILSFTQPDRMFRICDRSS